VRGRGFGSELVGTAWLSSGSGRMPFGKQPRYTALKIRTGLKAECSPRTWFSISRLTLTSKSSADKKGFDRVAVEIFDADLLVPSHCMMRAMPRVDLLGHPLFVRFRRQSHPSQRLSNNCSTLPRTSCKRRASARRTVALRARRCAIQRSSPWIEPRE
jgi:hypothetical protein